MSVPSELLLNTQQSFHTHAQRGANIVQRGGVCEKISVCKDAHNKYKKHYQNTLKEGKIGEIEQIHKEGEEVIKNFKESEKQKAKDRLKQKLNRRKEKQGKENAVKDNLMEMHNNSKAFGNLARASSILDLTVKDSETRAAPANPTQGTRGGRKSRKNKSKRTKRMARKSRRKSRKSRKSRRNQRGGRGRTITYANLDFMANNRLGKMVPHGDAYTNCNTQTGGGYGFTKEGASASETFKGGYPVFTKYEKSNQCGGKRRRRRKSRKSRKSKRKSRKSRRKRRKSRRRRKKRGRGKPICGSPGAEHLSPPECIEEMFGGQRGGSSHTYGSPVAVGSKPWATAPLGIQANKPSCYDNYNHYKGL